MTSLAGPWGFYYSSVSYYSSQLAVRLRIRIGYGPRPLSHLPACEKSARVAGFRRKLNSVSFAPHGIL